ncbi:hypothetical protein JCM8097_003907 [Rhodosporidiobolus ruineniae]
MPRASTSTSSASSTARRSSLTFKGPTTDGKRTRKQTSLIDPIPARRALTLQPKKRRRTSGETSARSSKGKRREEEGNEGGKRKRAHKDEGGTSKARGKRRRVEPDEDEDDAEDADEEDGASASEAEDVSSSALKVRPYERHVPRETVKKRWKVLSENAREDLRFEAERKGREDLDTLPASSTSAAHKALSALLTSFTSSLDSLLSTLPVPPLPSSIRIGSHHRAKGSRELELGWLRDRGEVKRRIAKLDEAYEVEQAEVEALEAKIEDERRLLEEAEETLEAFETARDKLVEVEAGEQETKASHPLLRPLLASRLPLSSHSLSHATTLGIPGLRAAAEKAVSREWVVPGGVGGTKQRGRGRKGEQEEDGEEASSAGLDFPSLASARLTRAMTEVKGVLKERKRGRKTSE